MSERIAFFAEKEEMEDFFGFQTIKEAIFSPHYNIAPAQHIPVVFKENGELTVKRARWGIENENSEDILPNLDPEDALEGLERGDFQRCVIPISGYYKWKDVGKRADHPFFIRMLHEPLMALAGVLGSVEEKERRDLLTCAIIHMESNALIQPLDPKMPIQLSKELSVQWLNKDSSANEILSKARDQFLLTEMTVLRVSDKVNDLSENSPELIQPLPK